MCVTPALSGLSGLSGLVGGVSEFHPTDLPGLYSLYTFDEGAGTTLIDQSGNGRNGTFQATRFPSWSGGGLQFSSVSGGDGVVLPFGPSDGITCVHLLAKRSAIAPPSSSLMSLLGSSQANAMSLFYQTSSFPQPGVNTNPLAGLDLYGGASGTSVLMRPIDPISPGSCIVLAWGNNAGDNVCEIYDGESDNTPTAIINLSAAVNPSVGGGTWRLGRTDGALNFVPAFDGGLYGAAFWTTTPNQSERQQVAGWLINQATGRGADLSWGNPDTGKVWAVDGDSRSVGYGSGFDGGWPTRIQNTLTGWKLYNFAISARSDSQIAAVGERWNRVVYAPSAADSLYIYMGGTNSDTDAAGNFARMAARINQALATGWQRCLVVPLYSGVGGDVRFADYNAMLAAWTTPVGVQVVDVSAATAMYGVGVYIGNTTYFSDNLHANGTGDQYIANLIAPYF